MIFRSLCAQLAALFVVVLLCATASAQGPLDGGQGQLNPLEAVRQVNAGMDADNASLKQSNQQARKRLRSDEKNLKSRAITPAKLEEARLDVSSAQTQLDSVQTRLSARQNDLDSLDRSIETLQVEPAENVDAPARLASSRAIKAALQTLVDKLRQSSDASETQLRLAQRRLSLLQQRFDLDELHMDTGNNRQRDAMQQAIDKYIRQASALRHQLRELSGGSAAVTARKQLLQAQAFDATERAELQANALGLLRRTQWVTQLSALSNNRAMPERTLRKARYRMAGIATELTDQSQSLERKLEVIKEQQAITEQRGAIADSGGSTLASQLDLFDSLNKDVGAQKQRVDNLRETAEQADGRFGAAISNALRRELVTRRTLPEDSQAWQELGADLTSLPARVLANLWGAAGAVWQRVVTASAFQWALLITLEGLLIAAVIWLRRMLDRTLIQKDLDRGAVLPMCALYWSLPTFVPAAVLLLLGQVLGVSTVNLVLLLTLLLVWPAVTFLLKMSFYLLVDEAPPESLAVRTKLHRELQWVLSLVGVIVGVSVIGRVVALSPGVLDVLERFSMVCLLLVALPALHVRRVILARSETELKESGFWIRFVAALSLLAPLALIACALIGLVGYIPLAWAIASHLGWFALVLAAWLLLESTLRDGVRSLTQKVQERNPENADFWNQNIIGPVYKLVALALAVVAGVILFRIFGWSGNTPIIRWLPDVLNTSLFTFGKATIHVRELVIAALVVVGVFWMGSWSKQVTYKFAYARISDYGIRQSLSTFTQYAVVVIGLYIAPKTIGLDLTALTVFAGALGVGIGFGLQNITSNFISGILLLIERPLRVSDIVNVEGIDGTVTHIGIRALTVRTFEQQEVVVPNSSVITKPFTNWTGGDDIYRTMFYVRVAYDADPHQAVELITNVVTAHKAVVKKPAPKVVLNDFTESCMLVRVQYFTHVLGKLDILDTRSQILFAVWDAFKQAGLRIPFPQHDVHLKQLPVPEEEEGPKSPPGEPA